MQETQALVQQGKVPAAYITAVATAPSLRDDLIKAQGTVIAPTIDHTVVSGSYASVPGLQKHQKRQPQGPPQPKSKRIIRALTKRKHTDLPAYKPAK